MADRNYPVFFDPSGVRKPLLGLAFIALGLLAALLFFVLSFAIATPAKLTTEGAPTERVIDNIARLTARDFELDFQNRSIANFIQTRLESHNGSSSALAPSTAALAGAGGARLRVGFFDSASREARVSLSNHVGKLDVVLGDWLNVDGESGAVVENEDAGDPATVIDNVISLIRSKNESTRIVAVVKSNGEKDYERLSDPAFRAALIRDLAASARRHHFDGFLIFVNQLEMIDLESMTLFLRELRSASPSSTMIALSAPADYAGSYGSIIAETDLIVARAFEPNPDGGEPTSLSPQPWFALAVDRARSAIPQDKLVVAIGSEGKDWGPNGPAKRITFAEGMRTAALSREGPIFDPINGDSAIPTRTRAAPRIRSACSTPRRS